MTGDARRNAWICAGLAAAAIAVYGPVHAYGFVLWDDPQYVSANPPVAAGLTGDGVRWAFTTGRMGNWHPLTWLSHMLDVSLFRMDAGWMHLVNLAFHVANTLLLFDLLRRMTGAVGRSAFVAALFAVHPLHVESVAWISERKDVLSTFFGFLTILAYVAHVRRPRPLVYTAMLLAFTASLLAKPMLVTLPGVLLLLDVWPLRRTERWTRLVAEKLPLFALAAAATVAAFVAQGRAGAVGASQTFPLAGRVANALTSYAGYVAKTVWPMGLSVFYPWRADVPARQVVGAALVLGVVSIVAVLAARRRPYLLVGWLWFLGTLTPVIGWVQVGSQSMADRYAYVPSVGLFVIVAWGAADLLACPVVPPSRSSFTSEVRPHRSTVAAAGAVIVCAVLARRQVETWRDTESLWEQALAVDPTNHVAHNNLAVELSGRGRQDEAITHLREAVRIDPRFADAHNNLGVALERAGRTPEALEQIAIAVRLAPDVAQYHRDFGVLLRATGDADAAAREFESALRLDPTDGHR